MHNPASVLENDTHKLLWDFDKRITYLGQKTRPYNNQQQQQQKKKNRTCKILDFAVSADDRIKLKESEKKD